MKYLHKNGSVFLFYICILFMMLFSLITVPYAANSVGEISDISGHWATAEINKWISLGLAKGNPNGTFRPNDPVTRAEFVTFVNRVFNFKDKASHIFKDVKDNAWYADEIAKAFKAGILIGDGRGIDIEKVKQKAVDKGLVTNDDVNNYSEREILQFLFKPGFSTKTDITDMSGRGVGLDVVKTNIEKLGGSIELFTNPGNGTTIRLLLPLTLAIIPSLIVEVENQKFALPQANLQEIVRIKPGDVYRRIEYIHNSEVLRLRGRLLLFL